MLENKNIRVEFDEKTGAVCGLLNKATNWQAVSLPKLSAGIILVYSHNGKEYFTTNGDVQTLALVKKISDTKIFFKWDGLLVKNEKIDAEIEITAELKDDGLNFSYDIVNNSNGIISHIRYPNFGGVRKSEGESDFTSNVVGMNGNFGRTNLGDGINADMIWPDFDQLGFATSYPTPGFSHPFEILMTNKQGLYLGIHNDADYHSVFNIIHEVYPAFGDSLRKSMPIPKDENDQCGMIVTFELCPHITARSRKVISNVCINMFEGTWHNGVKPYMAWREKWYKMMPTPSWFDDVDCWLTLHIHSSAGCARYKYTELPAIMAEAKQYGVKALQIIGWATGGQDGHEPYQDHDPRLGTLEELKQAFKEIREMGIKVLPMCKWRWFDDAYEPHKEFIPYIGKDRALRNYGFFGYSYQTVGQHLGMTIHGGAQLCHLSAPYRKLCIRELDKIMSLDVDGIMYDEYVFLTNCFSEDHGHRPGESCWNGGMDLSKEFYEHSFKQQEFLLCGEGVTDYLSQYFQCSYIRSASPIIEPVLPFINQELRYATCLTGFDNRGMVNQCLAFKYIINYEPFNFKGRMSEAPMTGEYGNKVLEFRMGLKDYLWLGLFSDTIGAECVCSEEPNGFRGKYKYTVFTNKKNGKKAVVIVNDTVDKDLTFDVTIDGGSGTYSLCDPENGSLGKTTGKEIKVKPRSVAVLVDE